MADKKKKSNVEEIDVFEAYEAKQRRASQAKKAKKAGAAAKKSARKSTSARSRKKKKKGGSSWWVWPVTALMIVVLAGLGVMALKEKRQYDQFILMRQTVNVAGFYPGISIDGRDVSGRSMEDVLADAAAREEQIKSTLNVTLACGGRSWTITADDLGYTSDYASVIQSAWQVGHEGSIAQRYDAIRRLSRNGAGYTVTRGWDESRLRAITNAVADELSEPAQNGQISGFDVDKLEFIYSTERNGTYVNGDQLYKDALAALRSGVGGQTVTASQTTLYPTETVDEIRPKMGFMASARTQVQGGRDRRNNIRLALSKLNGLRIEPGEIFSFNNTIGERTEDRGFAVAGVFVDGMSSVDVGGGICQVSTTLFNAVAKSDLELIARSPHSRPVDYVDPGKDAAVSWPNQDFKFQNDTNYPVYLVTEFDPTTLWCKVSIYGEMLPNGTYITIVSEVLEEFESTDPVYIKSSDLPDGQIKAVEKAIKGCYCESYKIYHSADGKEISRELYCRSTYAASGVKYLVGTKKS